MNAVMVEGYIYIRSRDKSQINPPSSDLRMGIAGPYRWEERMSSVIVASSGFLENAFLFLGNLREIWEAISMSGHVKFLF